MRRQRSENLCNQNKPPDPVADREIRTKMTSSSSHRKKLLDETQTQYEEQQNNEDAKLMILADKYAKNTFSIIYNHLRGIIFILNFLFFKSQPCTTNYRRRRRLSIRFFLFLLLFIKLVSVWSQKSAQAVTIQQQQDHILEEQYQSAFFEPPQPLVYMYESGSGEGQFPQSPSFNFKLSSSSSDSSQLPSSSVSPSLITAKCWNNYENDNDCKQINVITANNANDQQYDQSKMDDSLITPVVIFESSSTLEPSSLSNKQQPFQPPTFLAPPYFSSTFRPNSENVVLARHRTPPTSNDLYSASPAPTATILSPDSSSEVTQNSIYKNWQPASHPTQRLADNNNNNKWQNNDNNESNNEGDARKVVTMPTTNVFVATPQPKKVPKTTTLGRKCVDENDEDCDEPDDGSDDDNDRPNNNRNRYKNKNDDDDDTRGKNNNDPDSDDSAEITNNKVANQDSKGINNEFGSGDGAPDDSEDEDDDDDLDDGSGNSEPATLNPTPKYVDVTSFPPQTVPGGRTNNEIESVDSSSSVKPGAEIEVVVHPTLPPTFPLSTTPMTPNYENPQDINPTKQTTTTIMPDDTYTSKPVFPSSTSSEIPSGDSTKKNQFGNEEDHGSATTDPNQLSGGTSTDLDLATFKPIPMPPVDISQDRWPNQANSKFDLSKNQSSGIGSGSPTADDDTNTIPEKNKFDPTSDGESRAPIKFDNPWRALPVQRPSFNQIDQQQKQQQAYSQQRATSRHRPDPRASPTTNELNPPVNQVRMQSDILPTMLLYASIFILIVTALIFIIMAFALWRRNTARQRALLRKTQQQIMNNGSASSHQLVGSMSHGSQLMANIQQPGLLSTYAPGKGLTVSKVTSSIMRGGENELDNMIGEEDERNQALSFDQTKGDRSLDGSENILRDRGQADATNCGVTGVDGGVRTSSWSTDQDPTTTTSSGSQKTDLGKGELANGSGGHLAASQLNRPQYPNSLSDGRQNSSSISDSQCSPDEMRQQTSQPQFPAFDHQQTNYPQSHHLHQGTSNFLNGGGAHNQPISSLQNGSNPQHNQIIYNQQQAHTVIPDSVKLQQKSQLKNKQQQQHFISSRSVENLARNDGYNLESGRQTMCEPQQSLFHHQTPYLMQQSPRHRMMNDQQILPLGQQPNLNGIPQSNKPPAMFPPLQNINAQRAYLSNSPGAQATSLDGYPPNNQQHINGNVRLTNGQYGPAPGPGPFNSEYTHFNVSNMNMARVAMNPSATLGRRYPAGIGLNRNIYSEDSSSLMTASPSLARTSSSLSFAFSSTNQPSTPIRAKPLVDASGRVYNDYTQSNFAGANNNSSGPPPVLGRKDRSEAWYV